jgi:arginine decarboxylase
MESLIGGNVKLFFLVSGVGYGSTELTSFDAALLDAGIGDFNLVRMSSIMPPGFSQAKMTKPTRSDSISVI